MEEYRRKIFQITCFVFLCFFAFIGFTKGTEHFLNIKRNTIYISVKNKNYIPNNLKASVVEQSTKKQPNPNDELKFNGLSIDEVALKLNKRLGGVLKNKGEVYANIAMSYGMDPFIPAAISILETGNGTSYLASKNNVGGIKCSATRYCVYPTIDDGIQRYIVMIYKNYYLKGLTTVDLMASRYAESPTWAQKVNKIYNEMVE